MDKKIVVDVTTGVQAANVVNENFTELDRKTLEASTVYNEDTFTTTKAYNQYGSVASTTGWGEFKSTPKVHLLKGETVTAKVRNVSSSYPPILIYDTEGLFVKRIAPTVDEQIGVTRYTADSDCLMVVQTADLLLEHFYTINKNENGYLTSSSQNEIDSKLEIPSINTSMFRTPSLATGGVVTIIDDDGKSDLYSLLYPFLNGLGVPFGMAINPSNVGKDTYITLEQLNEMNENESIVEVLNHNYTHTNLTTLTETQINEQLLLGSKWFSANDISCQGFVLPNGGDSLLVRRLVQKYYNSCYDYQLDTILTFDTINNDLIKRTSFDVRTDVLTIHKALVDQAVAQNGWLVITTHVSATGYWDATTQAKLQELIEYIDLQGAKILKPRDAFQIFGNIIQNDSSFRIQSNGKIVGAI